ncbi:PDZK1-interacting protein 1 [Sminthopsis crassicaudata]|uniref:PDZK1-interacting protein 1 n=1 Tax=Sminthopsis crassicaudata TaxID=9301 RepID=UPI003D680CAF
METPELLLLGLLMTVEPVTCQQGLGTLEPWMQGLIAVAVFLALVAIAFAVNHFWCRRIRKEPVTMVMSVGGKSEEHLAGVDGKYSPMALNFRSSEHKNAYENENVMEDIPGVRSTPM